MAEGEIDELHDIPFDYGVSGVWRAAKVYDFQRFGVSAPPMASGPLVQRVVAFIEEHGIKTEQDVGEHDRATAKLALDLLRMVMHLRG